jgi:hypothetical protein
MSSGGRSTRWGFVDAPLTAQPEVVHRLPRVEAWLDYLIELGASGLALGPIFTSASHGYDTNDYYRIDPRLGDEADFAHLVEQAHARGIRVLLDGVFNHVGRDFPMFQEGRADWFHLYPGGEYEHFEGTSRSRDPQPRIPGGRRLRGRRHVPLARARGRRVAPRRGVRDPGGFLGAGPATGPRAVPAGVHRRRDDPRGLRRLRPGSRAGFRDGVRTLEGDLEFIERPELPRTHLDARPPQRFPRALRAADVPRQPRCHPHRQQTDRRAALPACAGDPHDGWRHPRPSTPATSRFPGDQGGPPRRRRRGAPSLPRAPRGPRPPSAKAGSGCIRNSSASAAAIHGSNALAPTCTT